MAEKFPCETVCKRRKINICIVTTVEHNCTCTSCRYFCRTSTVGDTKSEAGDCVWCGCYSVFVISSLLLTLFHFSPWSESRSADERYMFETRICYKGLVYSNATALIA
ncbi:conserved domain protein [Trichinella spiralis]|uniref:hypothetical protein n=1 Tax=Trichinella spiralis TaxID=6334 RepID=UPI0001EFCD78|nr:conserved domain protein [Trichinella spiralis]